MNIAQRWLRLGAVAASVAFHAAVLLPLLDEPIGSSRGAMFEVAMADEQRPMRAFRALDDAAFADAEADGPRAMAVESDEPADAAEQVRRTSEQLLDQADPVEQLPPQPGKPIDPAAVAPDRPDLAPPDPGADAARPGAAAVIDAAAQLAEAVSPPLDLPTFTGATDEPATAQPAQGPIDIGRATGDAALRGAVGRGDGHGAGAGDGFGAGFNPFADGVPLAPPTQADPLDPQEQPPLAKLPRIDLARPTLPEGDEPRQPPVNLDTDFEYALHAWHGPLVIERGWFKDDEVIREPTGWFEIQIRPKPSLRRLTPLKKDVVYVVDTSSSIGYDWLGSIKRGVIGSLDSLNKGDRFNVVMFRETVNVLAAGGLLEATRANREKAAEFIRRAEGAGYTDVNKALAQLVRRDLGDDRVYQVIFISDGKPTAGTVGARQIIDVFTRANNLVAGVYAVAVGNDVNAELLGALAYRNKGRVIRPGNAAKAGPVIRDLASRIQYPILKDATFNAAGVNTRHIYPRQPRDVYQHEPITLFGRHAPDDERLTMRITGASGPRRLTFGTTLKFDAAAPADRALASRWATAYLYHLRSQILRLPDAEQPALRDRIEQLKRIYQLQ